MLIICRHRHRRAFVLITAHLQATHVPTILFTGRKRHWFSYYRYTCNINGLYLHV